MARKVLFVVLLLFAFPVGALAQGSATTPTPPVVPGSNPFALPESQPQQQTATVQSQPTSSSSSGSSLSSGQKLALVIGGIIVLAIVGLFIARDARRRAPARHAGRVRAAAAPTPPLTPRPGARGLHTGRGKGKAAGKKRRR